jgi:hypothetical protein
MITKDKFGKIKRQMYIKIFHLARRNIYLIMFAKFIFENIFLFNQIIIEIDIYIKLIE